MYDLENLMYIVPQLSCDYSDMDERSAEYLQKLDHAIDMAVCAETRDVDFSDAAKAIFDWVRVSQEFFSNPPDEVEIKDLDSYVEIHNRLLAAAMAAARANKFKWPPQDED